ncbi:MAG: VWA domain-containing protein [Chloroflexi bacterium AL-W]|nr:VWA domain-containing protein [Chloroflexi bacterium AL-N1]NOK70673.1 VWA domain-containing protein [Chloroflexi bacterium AL-N10]NOK78492.1 VWA domain-containing protein [Chloroflexi bacterium AL-N5]NOK85576.1 VWA domain-containing protein [Chloroflexi bacterium AL-W]NOK92490.1 VWA domain-containing protein [Chloroflexi bacterium AL-N15]
MLRLSFVTPAALVLLVLLPLLWSFVLLTPRQLASWRFWASLLIRSVILVALIFALAGVQLILPVQSVATVFLVDGSDSVSPAQRQQAVEYIDTALENRPSGDVAGVVVFGENALVEHTPADLATVDRLRSIPLATRTNIQDAIQLGLALLPADMQKRLVLISDGSENSGRAVDAARLSAFRGVPIDVVFLPSESGPDVIVSALEAPTNAREGQDIVLNTVIQSSLATSGQLQVFVDDQLIDESEVTVDSGTTEIPIRVGSGEAGFRRLEVRLAAEGDTAAQNNRASAFTNIEGPPRLLIIASDANRAVNLQSALTASDVRVDVRAPDQVPADLAQLSDYAGVIIVDTPARDIPRAVQEILPAYVRDLGRGVAMIGGEESFGAGGYRRTPIEDILPVSLDPLDNREQPDVALAMVIDRSGSMSDTSGSGRTRLDLAKEAVYQASLGLGERDQIGLVVFDSAAQWVLPLQQLPPAIEIEQALSTFDSGGGTNIRPGVERAAEALAEADARVKHVILLTDGMADSNYSDLIDQMSEQGVTISTVALGNDANPNLRQIAERGSGRYYLVRDVSDVPTIFLQETVFIAGRDIVEEEFTPQIALQSPFINTLSGLPPLYGYNGTELKRSTRTLLVTPDGKPILAQWQYGLGRTIAWTSDFKGQWARDWVGWDQFPRFVDGMLETLLPTRVDDQISLQSSVSGSQILLDLTASDAEGQPLSDLTLAGRLVDPDDAGVALEFEQIGENRYRAVVDADTTGVYLAQVSVGDAQGQALGIVQTGVVVSYSPEYSEVRQNRQLLQDVVAIAGGRFEPAAATAFEPTPQTVGAVREIAIPLLWLALLLWPFDIAVRRLFLRFSEAFAGMRTLLRRWQPAPEKTPTEWAARLGKAKQRVNHQQTSVSSEHRVESPSTSMSVPSRAEEVPAKPDSVPKPAPSEKPKKPRAAPVSKPSTSLSDDQFARLLSAKRRARDKQD